VGPRRPRWPAFLRGPAAVPPSRRTRVAASATPASMASEGRGLLTGAASGVASERRRRVGTGSCAARHGPRRCRSEVAGNDELLDVARAFVDRAHAHIPAVALHREILQVAVA